MRLTAYTLILASALFFPAHGQYVLSPHARIAAEHGAKTESRAYCDSTVSVYVKIDAASLDTDWLRAHDIDIVPLAGEMATARVNISALADLAQASGIKYVQTATAATQMLDLAAPETGARKVRDGIDLTRPYTGRGVVVGVVDAGFDYCHAAFHAPDGSLRIKRVWEQSSSSGIAPEKYGYGIELTTPEAIEGAGGDILNNSHGTHVAAIAAGSDTYLDGIYQGIAPEADIVLVSMGEGGDNNVNISNAISYIFDYAEAQGKPCVVNLSLGAHSGPHDGTSTFDVIADAMQGPGRLIVGASGNHRADKFHVTHTFDSGEAEPLRTFIDFGGVASTKHLDGTVEFWGTAGCDYEVALAVYNTSRNELAERVTVYPSEETVSTVTLGRNVTGDMTVASEISPLNGKPNVVITNGIKSLRANYAVAIEVTAKGAGQVDLWADNTKLHLSAMDKEGFTDPGTSPTVAEIGGTAKRILTVGAYTTRPEYTLLNETEVKKLNETMGEICSFSGNGPTADGRMKPQVAAPGCYIVSAVSSNDGSGSLQIAQAHNDGVREHMYGYMQGTSMSSPLVAGIVATWLEACPTLTPEQLAEVVAKTARRDENTGTEADCDWGYGKIDAYAGLAECLDIAGITSPNADQDMILTISGGQLHITMLRNATEGQLSIYSPSGICVAHRTLNGMQPGEATAVSLESLAAGVYILTFNISGGSPAHLTFVKD